MRRKGSQFHFVCIIPSPRLALLSAKRELPSMKEFPTPGKGEWGVQPASPASLGNEQKTHSMSPPPETSEAERYRDSWEQRRRASITSIRTDHGSQWSTPQETPATFTAEETDGQHSCCGPLQIF